MLTGAVYLASSLYVVGSVVLLIVSLKYAFKKSVVQPIQEPDALWVLGLEEALASL